MMFQRVFFCTALLFMCGSDPSRGEAIRKPNILLLCVDDLRTQLGCYGDDVVQSPNIDRLSASGVTFDRCYVQVAVCNPSRASMMTGLRPNTLKCWSLPYHFRETKPDAVTLPQYLRRHGFHAEGYGKIFHNPWQDPASWSVPHRFGPGNWSHYTKEQKAFTEKVRASLPDGAWQKSNLRGLITNAPEIKDSEHPDGAMADIVIERMKALKETEEPFFLAAGFILPHLPWCPPKRYWDLYEREDLPLASNPEVPENTPAVALSTNYEFSHYADCVGFPTPTEGKVTDEEARRFIHAYLASISFIDTQVGRVLGALEETGLAGETIVVLWSDHGYKLGEHNGWGKMTNFEIDTRVPFIIRDPRAEANGKRCERIVETLDLFPTLCELAGLPVPGFAEGRSLAGLLENPGREHTGAAYSQYVYPPLIGNSVRTAEWRYTEWREMTDGTVKHRVLYDHRSDSGENKNVAGGHPEEEAVLEKTLANVLPPRPVKLLGEVRSAKGGRKIEVKFVNRYSAPVRVSWIDPVGRRKAAWDLGKGRRREVKSFVGHVFVAESLDGRWVERIRLSGERKEIPLGVEVR